MTETLENALSETAGAMPSVEPTADMMQQRLEGGQDKVPSTDENKSLDGAETKKKRGRPKKDPAAPRAPVSAPPLKSLTPAPGAPEQSNDAAIRQELAGQVIALVEQSGTIMAGDAAKMVDTEKSALVGNMDNYLKAKNISDIPPGLLLGMGLAMYYGRVAKTEVEIAGKKVPLYVKTAIWWQAKFGKKEGYARFNNGNDRERKDNAR